MEDKKTLSLKKEKEPEVSPDIQAQLDELAELRAEKLAREEAEADRIKANEAAASQVTINIPPAGGKSIRYGGREFFHGMTYSVPNDVKWGLEEVTNRLWAHEASLHESENKGRKQRRAYVQQ